MAMGTYPTLFHTHGKENFVRTTLSSRPRPPQPGPAQPRSVALGLHAAAEH